MEFRHFMSGVVITSSTLIQLAYAQESCESLPIAAVKILGKYDSADEAFVEMCATISHGEFKYTGLKKLAEPGIKLFPYPMLYGICYRPPSRAWEGSPHCLPDIFYDCGSEMDGSGTSIKIIYNGRNNWPEHYHPFCGGQPVPRKTCSGDGHYRCPSGTVGSKNISTCGPGNPINPNIGNKHQPESDFNATNPLLNFARTYNSKAFVGWERNITSGIGPKWQHNFSKFVYRQANASPVFYAALLRPNGQIFEFLRNSEDAPWTSTADVRLSIQSLTSGFQVRDPDAGLIETYDADGNLLSVSDYVGRKVLLGRTGGVLQEAVDHFGRKLTFQFQSGLLTLLTSSDGVAIAYQYDTAGNLTFATYPDGFKRQYHYNESGNTSGTALPDALTGISEDANSGLFTRYATYQYDLQGRAIVTKHAGDTNKYEISYPSLYGNSTITTPSQTTTTQNYTNILGAIKLSSQSQPAGSGCSASTSNVGYDSNANKISEDDFNGKRACFTYDNLNREKLRIEGLNGGASGTSCSAALSATNVSTLVPEARKISTEWHPDWALATRRAEPGKITTWVYNGQPDPFNGNAIAGCTSPMYGASSVDTLPDGKPIVVLCKQVEQSTTDVNGSQGFAATLQPASVISASNPTPVVTSRTVSYTYNQYGQVLSSTDERGATTYTYYDATTATHTKGDLWKVTNALGHVTEYTSYNPHGQVLQAKDANGVITSYTYDLRQRMTSVTQAGQLTQIDWWPTGLLKKVTQPDGSFLAYTYDDAHRLTDIADNLGNNVHYVLDNAGNRTSEQVKDASGALTRQIDRNFDALNRLWKTSTGAPI